MQNKANSRNDKMSANIDMTSFYKILSRRMGQKTNPIQTQFKPKQTQFNPIQTQFKANQSQFVVSLSNLFKPNSKNERFCVDKKL